MRENELHLNARFSGAGGRSLCSYTQQVVSGTGRNTADRSKCVLTLIILHLHRISAFVKACQR